MRIRYIGDAVSAVGFALVGASTRTPDPNPEQVWAELVAARRDADLVVLSQTHAATVRGRLALLYDDPVPPVVTIPSLADDTAMSHDAAGAARRALGLS